MLSSTMSTLIEGTVPSSRGPGCEDGAPMVLVFFFEGRFCFVGRGDCARTGGGVAVRAGTWLAMGGVEMGGGLGMLEWRRFSGEMLDIYIYM